MLLAWKGTWLEGRCLLVVQGEGPGGVAGGLCLWSRLPMAALLGRGAVGGANVLPALRNAIHRSGAPPGRARLLGPSQLTPA